MVSVVYKMLVLVGSVKHFYCLLQEVSDISLAFGRKSTSELRKQWMF
jgi:hypothetical protein